MLKRLHKLGGKTPGPGIWRVRDSNSVVTSASHPVSIFDRRQHC